MKDRGNRRWFLFHQKQDSEGRVSNQTRGVLPPLGQREGWST